jgi:hypothetical protein
LSQMQYEQRVPSEIFHSGGAAGGLRAKPSVRRVRPLEPRREGFFGLEIGILRKLGV